MSADHQQGLPEESPLLASVPNITSCSEVGEIGFKEKMSAVCKLVPSFMLQGGLRVMGSGPLPSNSLVALGL